MFSLLKEYSKKSDFINKELEIKNSSSANNVKKNPSFLSTQTSNRMREIYEAQKEISRNEKNPEVTPRQSTNNDDDIAIAMENTRSHIEIEKPQKKNNHDRDDFSEGESSDFSDSCKSITTCSHEAVPHLPQAQQIPGNNKFSTINKVAFKKNNNNTQKIEQEEEEEEVEQTKNNFYANKPVLSAMEQRLNNLKKAREAQLKYRNEQSKLANPNSNNKPKPAFEVLPESTGGGGATRKNSISNNRIISNAADEKNQNQYVQKKKNYKRKSKMEKFKMWNSDCYFVSIDPPVNTPEFSKSRYKISFKYFCGIDKKFKRKTVVFGKKDTEYLVDHGDEDRNRIWLSKQRGYYTPFHKNFWINYLLCSDKNIQKAYNKTLENLLN